MEAEIMYFKWLTLWIQTHASKLCEDLSVGEDKFLMRSDNGTNFVGAERELTEALASLDQTLIERSLSQKGIKWSFNPPAASRWCVGVHHSDDQKGSDVSSPSTNFG